MKSPEQANPQRQKADQPGAGWRAEGRVTASGMTFLFGVMKKFWNTGVKLNYNRYQRKIQVNPTIWVQGQAVYRHLSAHGTAEGPFSCLLRIVYSCLLPYHLKDIIFFYSYLILHCVDAPSLAHPTTLLYVSVFLVRLPRRLRSHDISVAMSTLWILFLNTFHH